MMNSSHQILFFSGVYAAAFDNELEWLIVKGISDFLGSSESAREPWEHYANGSAASLVAHILSDPNIFTEWRNYAGTNDHKRFFFVGGGGGGVVDLSVDLVYRQREDVLVRSFSGFLARLSSSSEQHEFGAKAAANKRKKG